MKKTTFLLLSAFFFTFIQSCKETDADQAPQNNAPVVVTFEFSDEKYSFDELRLFRRVINSNDRVLLSSADSETEIYSMTLPAEIDEQYLSAADPEQLEFVDVEDYKFLSISTWGDDLLQISAYKSGILVCNAVIDYEATGISTLAYVNKSFNGKDNEVSEVVQVKKGWNIIRRTGATAPQSTDTIKLKRSDYLPKDPGAVLVTAEIETMWEHCKQDIAKNVLNYYTLEAALTHEVETPQSNYYEQFGDFTFTPSDNLLLDLMRNSSELVTAYNDILYRLETEEYSEYFTAKMSAELLFYRAYTYSLLLNYFGGMPIRDKHIGPETPLSEVQKPRNTAQEVTDFILSDCEVAANSFIDTVRYAALQLAARVLINNGEYAQAIPYLQAVINSVKNSLPVFCWLLEDAIGPEFPYSTDKYSENLIEEMQKGYWLYLFSYAETLLLYAEANLETGNIAEALSTINQLNECKGDAPLQSQNIDELRDVIDALGDTILDREGLTFARLKRNGKFLERLSRYGAEEKHKLLPIPLQIIISNPLIVQNPGWE